MICARCARTLEGAGLFYTMENGKPYHADCYALRAIGIIRKRDERIAALEAELAMERESVHYYSKKWKDTEDELADTRDEYDMVMSELENTQAELAEMRESAKRGKGDDA